MFSVFNWESPVMKPSEVPVPTQDSQLTKNYGKPVLYHNQFGCNRLFLDVTRMFIKEHQPKRNYMRNWITSKTVVVNYSEATVRLLFRKSKNFWKLPRKMFDVESIF